jgi:hypothetical protein
MMTHSYYSDDSDYACQLDFQVATPSTAVCNYAANFLWCDGPKPTIDSLLQMARATCILLATRFGTQLCLPTMDMFNARDRVLLADVDAA